MSPELDRQLCERYPLVFRERHQDEPTTPMHRGFECGDGWYALIDAACAVVSAPYENARFAYLMQREGDSGAEAVERLRLEMEARAREVPAALQVKEKLGTLRIHLDGGGERARAASEFAGVLSASVCEICGAYGALMQDGGWMRVRCDAHQRE